MLEFVAYFTKGLGDVVAGELREILRPVGGVVGEPGERFVVVGASVEGAGLVLSGAWTVDDFRLLVAGPGKVTGEAEFRALCEEAARRTKGFLAQDEARAGAGAGAGVAWSVTVSARKPAWGSGRGGWSPGPVIAGAWPGADLAGTTRAPVDLRVQVDGEVMHVAVSLGRLGVDRPLAGRRGDQGGNRLGALRPTVAAAMVRMALAELDVGRAGCGGCVLYDPFAGTGTIVAEALRVGLGVFASDVDPEAVRMTRKRVARLGGGGGHGGAAGTLGHRVFEHDVRRGAARRVRADLVVGNMPWGKQVQIPRRQELFDGTAEVIRPVLTAGGVAVLLTTHEEQFTARLRRALPGGAITTRRIGLLGQTPAIVTVHPA